MADWTTISSLATAGGTLVLAVATFGSVRSANRAARVAEQTLLFGVRPMLIPSRDDDPDLRVMFVDRRWFTLPGHAGLVEAADGNLYLAISIRNAGAGIAVLHGWRAAPYRPGTPQEPPDLDEFTRQGRDLYIPVGEHTYWQGAVRDRSHPAYPELVRAAEERLPVTVDLLYGDVQGGQRAVARFGLTYPDEGGERFANAVRYWNIDGEDPR